MSSSSIYDLFVSNMNVVAKGDDIHESKKFLVVPALQIHYDQQPCTKSKLSTIEILVSRTDKIFFFSSTTCARIQDPHFLELEILCYHQSPQKPNHNMSSTSKDNTLKDQAWFLVNCIMSTNAGKLEKV